MVITSVSTTRLFWTLMLTATLAIAATDTQAEQRGQSEGRQDSRNHEHGKPGRPWAIVGPWFGTTTSGLTQLITFHADGTVLRSVPGEVGIDPARPPHTPAHGVWRYLGKGRFGVTMWDIFYDVSTGQLRHFMKIRLEVTIGEDTDEATGTAVLETLDPQGVVIASRTGGISFARIPYEPLD
jgi:hypothetical protein